MSQMSEINAMIAKLVDGWCDRRALRPPRIILGGLAAAQRLFG